MVNSVLDRQPVKTLNWFRVEFFNPSLPLSAESEELYPEMEFFTETGSVTELWAEINLAKAEYSRLRQCAVIDIISMTGGLRDDRLSESKDKARKRLEAKLQLNTIDRPGCLEFTGRTDRHGHGVMSYNGRGRPAHRVAWELQHGELPKYRQLSSSCGNPRCCNLEHLYLRATPGVRGGS